MKTLNQQETEAFLSMARTIESLTQQVKELTERVERAERANKLPYSPSPLPWVGPTTPVNPYPWTQPWPSYPPYTITCKMADGTTKDITMTSPIVAQNNG